MTRTNVKRSRAATKANVTRKLRKAGLSRAEIARVRKLAENLGGIDRLEAALLAIRYPAWVE